MVIERAMAREGSEFGKKDGLGNEPGLKKTARVKERHRKGQRKGQS